MARTNARDSILLTKPWSNISVAKALHLGMNVFMKESLPLPKILPINDLLTNLNLFLIHT